MKPISRSIRFLTPAALVLSLVAGCASAPDNGANHTGAGTAAPLVRSTAYGKVEGTSDGNGAYFWKGIPFAKPPVGQLRWKAPVEPDAWNATFQATRFGNACAQYGRIYGPGANNTYDATIGTTLNQPVGSEDCLTLNIWRPADADTNLPVIYFIYGGSNVSGYTGDPVYDGAALAKLAHAVVVTANYRVGALGWFDLAQLKRGTSILDDSGNFGTLDQVQTLKFINKNIGNFGGNSGNVTLMGESAGAINLYALLTSPLVVNTKPQLFHRAIALSGGFALPTDLPPGTFPLVRPESFALAQGKKLLNALLIADGKASDDATAETYIASQSDAQIADYVRSKTTGEIFKQWLTTLAKSGLAITSHIPDGNVVSSSPIAAIKAGNYLKVPILASNTREEGKLFSHFLALSPAWGGKSGFIVSDPARFDMMMKFDPNAATNLSVNDIIAPSYLPTDEPVTGYNARTGLLSQAVFYSSRDVTLNALKSKQDNVWYFMFAWNNEPAPWNEVYGAAHLLDVPFEFGNFGPSVFSRVMGGEANKAGRLALSSAMMHSIAAFAKNGDPNNASLGTSWPTWPQTLIFDATLTEKKISVK